MTKFDHGAFIGELRRRRKSVPQDWYDDIIASIEIGLGNASPAVSKSGEPVWLIEARKHMGVKEIPGKQHNPLILTWIRKLGGWFTDDETPWCGTFVAHCMRETGFEVPKHWYRARDWASWGKPTQARVGAIAVFARGGGGHVGFVVGESKSAYYILGGNQSNAVNITPLSKTRILAFRWPASQPLSSATLLAMTGGTVSRNEA